MSEMKNSKKEPKKLDILSRAVESASEGFITIDENHHVIFFNHAAEKMFGYRREEVRDKNLNAILTPTCSRDHQGGVTRYMRTKRPHVMGHAKEMVAARKDGSLFPCTISISVSRLDGRFFFTGIVRDLSETRTLQEEIAKKARLAELGRMVAEINHEIKNPLMIIGGFINRLARTTVDKTILNQISVVGNEITRLENLLEELRRLFLPRRLHLSLFDLNELLEEVYLLTVEHCKECNIHVAWVPSPDPLPVKADRGKMKQVLINVIQNATEAMGEQGTLSISTTRSGEKLTLKIEDNGPGIPEDVQPRVFDPFFTTKKRGSGLGLPLCKRIIEDHKEFSFQLKSQPGKGTTIVISMPLNRLSGQDS